VFGNNVSGLRMPDGIAAFTQLPAGGFARGKDYFITANEGDGREWGGFTDELRRNTGLSARLKTLADDTTVPYTAFGSRSISLFDADTGDLVWDSGNTLQSVAIAAGVYDDSRSDDKGVEPEGIAVARIDGRTYAIAGLERTSRSSASDGSQAAPRRRCLASAWKRQRRGRCHQCGRSNQSWLHSPQSAW
jgi:hypothetical protein